MYHPIRGGTWIELPKWIKNKQCCINVKNLKTNQFKCINKEDQHCFEYALESILNPPLNTKNPDRPSHYNINKYNELSMTYPVQITKQNIEKYETLVGISINVYGTAEENGEEQPYLMHRRPTAIPC